MKNYFAIINRPAAGLKICGGGWTLEEALLDAENNCGKDAISALRENDDAADGAYSVSVVSEGLGKIIEKEGSTPELAARVYAEAM